MSMRDTASAQPFLSPAERREHARQVNQIVKLAAEGKYPEALWPVAASVGFGPQDLKRLPVEVAAGIAEAQEKLTAKPARVGRNLAALIELCGVETILREESSDLLEILEKAATRAAILSLARNMRCNEAAAGEQLSHASANVTAVEAQRSGNTAARLIASTLQVKHMRQKLEIEAGKAERDGLLQPEARRDEIRRGRKISERVESDRAREKYQKQRDEQELAMALETAAEEAAKRHATTAPPEAEEAGEGPSCRATPYTVSGDVEAMPVAGVGRTIEVPGEVVLVLETDVASAEATEAEQGQNRHATPYTVSNDPRLDPRPRERGASATAELLVPAAMLPLPLADRRAAASDALRELQSPAAKNDPADGWEVEMLGIAVRTGRASASIVARFVEETSAGDIFPEPGSAAGKRPTFPEFLGRLAPRGWPRVTATGSSSMSLMT
jgi:hypothetical protein